MLMQNVISIKYANETKGQKKVEVNRVNQLVRNNLLSTVCPILLGQAEAGRIGTAGC